MKNVLTLEEKVAVVTGGTNGIGRAIAVKLAEAGVKVAIVGRNEERAKQVLQEIEGNNGIGKAILGDISKEKCCEEIVGEVKDFFGEIDILVNCAGILASTSISEVTRREWDEILAGRMGGYENSQSYTASKGGMIAITMGIARQLAPCGITVNVVCPGTTETEMTKLYDEETKERLCSRIPMGRLAKPEEIAAAVCFFASEEASYITGAILDVNGGMYMG